MKTLSSLAVVVALSFVPVYAVRADNHHDAEQAVEVEIKATTTKLSDHVYVIQGLGGNVGLFVDEHDVFLIDNDHKEISPLILDAIQTITDKPVRFLVNTHWHGDHTGGNEMMGKGGAVDYRA